MPKGKGLWIVRRFPDHDLTEWVRSDPVAEYIPDCFFGMGLWMCKICGHMCDESGMFFHQVKEHPEETIKIDDRCAYTVEYQNMFSVAEVKV